MIGTLTSLHFGFAAVWLGCVLTEALFERALLAGDRNSHLVLADLHVRVDKWIELPAIVIVLATGVLLFRETSPSGTAYLMMFASGLIAILANLYCVCLVFRRQSAAHRGDWEMFDRLDHMQHKIGAIVLLGIVVAMVADTLGRI